MSKRPSPLIALALCLTFAGARLSADNLSALPVHWGDSLLPVAETDLGGAERLMREAVLGTRAQVAELLAQEQPDRVALAGAYGQLGALLLLLEIEAQADLCFRNAQTLQPGEFRWPYYAGYLAMTAGNVEEALSHLRIAEAIDPSYPTLRLRLGKVHLDRNELAQARTALEQITDIPGLSAAANYHLGQIALMERRHEDAVAHLEQALAANPNADEVHYPLAQAYRGLGQNDLARDHLSRFQPRDPVAEDPLLDQLKGAGKRSLPAFDKGIHAIRQGDYAAASEHFAEGLAVDPENARARVSYARALYLSGQAGQAGDELNQAIEAEPNLVLANFLRGVLHQEQGDEERARRHYRRTLGLNPGHAGALFYLANLDFSNGSYDTAARGYTAALAADTEIPPARLMALVSRYRAGETEADILEGIERLIGEHPQDPMPQYALTRLLASARDAALRRPQQALELANRLALLQPAPPHQRLQALALAASGDFDQAARIQRQVIAMSVWTASQTEQKLMQMELATFERYEMPGEPWPEGDILLSPPPFDPVAPFRDYPAAVPY